MPDHSINGSAISVNMYNLSQIDDNCGFTISSNLGVLREIAHKNTLPFVISSGLILLTILIKFVQNAPITLSNDSCPLIFFLFGYSIISHIL